MSRAKRAWIAPALALVAVLLVVMILPPSGVADDTPPKMDLCDVLQKYGEVTATEYHEKVCDLTDVLDETQGCNRKYKDTQDCGTEWQCDRFTEYTIEKLEEAGYRVMHAWDSDFQRDDGTKSEHHWLVVEIVVSGVGGLWVPVEATPPDNGKPQTKLGYIPYKGNCTEDGVVMFEKFDARYYGWDGLRDPLKCWAADTAGSEKDNFMDDEDVYFSGQGFRQSVTYKDLLYVVKDGTDWSKCSKTLPARVKGSIQTVATDGAGNVTPPILIWAAADTAVGSYDIMVDCNKNGVYDPYADAVDGAGGRAGFIVEDDTSKCIVTPIGAMVFISLFGASVNFTQVDTEGCTAAFTLTCNPVGPMPCGYQLAGSVVDIATTAFYEGPVTVALTYDESLVPVESAVRLFHWDGGRWQDITTSVDSANNVVYGVVNSLSPFALGYPGTGIPAFPSLYVGLAAAFGAGVLAFVVRRRLVRQE